MKKLLKFTNLLIISGILFSSCETSTSIMKRHYRSGYYIDYTSHNKETAPKLANGNTAQIVIPIPISNAQSLTMQSTSSTSPKQSIEKPPIVITGLKKILPTTNLQSITKQSHLNRTGITSGSAIENKQIISQSPFISTNVSDGDRGERAALSLLWLVIVIVLILWLIGILAGGFGLGGLINLLLVIALILLILWLLRVI